MAGKKRKNKSLNSGQMLKRLMQSEAWLSGTSALAARFIRLVFNSSKVTYEPADTAEQLHKNAPAIFAMWHGQFLMIPIASPKGLPVKCMVARHGDAEIVSRTMARFGHGLIRGAGAGDRRKDRGGVHALREALRTLKAGECVAMTADVPPGPARKAGEGIVTLARMSGRPVIPVAIATKRFMAFNTWSRFTVNLPFSKLAAVCGEPVTVARNASPEELETARITIENSLNAATDRAYQITGGNITRATPFAPGIKFAPGLPLRIYRALTHAMRPFAGALLRHRSNKGKEVRERLGERMGLASIPRPNKTLLWFHAASVGETNTVLPLIEELRRKRPDIGVLLTTVTVTSAKIAASRLPEGAIHQFVPLDSPAFVTRFFDHWRPDMALFTESEIWPNLILEADKRDIPLALLNAIMSERSTRRWSKMPSLSRPLFSRFSVVLTQSKLLTKRLKTLGALNVITAGNIKFDAPPPPIDAEKLALLKDAIRTRPVFLAASTHPGEDEMIAVAHQKLRETVPGLLTIIAPRHPERGSAMAAMAEGLLGFSVARRSTGDALTADTEIYVSDTIGELGLFYSLATVAFIGGSLVPHGGHNPIEAVKLGAGVISGPHWHNFPEVYKAITNKGGCKFVKDSDELTQAVRTLLSDTARLEAMRAGASEAVNELSGAMERTLAALEPFLPPLDPSAAEGSAEGITKRVAYAP
ncbi:MAG: glycosyltransferase N-terminal domain-containing protein [Alphaproteobacteria bacterium]